MELTKELHSTKFGHQAVASYGGYTVRVWWNYDWSDELNFAKAKGKLLAWLKAAGLDGEVQ